MPPATPTRSRDHARIQRPMPRAARRRARWREPIGRVAAALTAPPPADRVATLDESCWALVVEVPDEVPPVPALADDDGSCYALVVEIPDEPDDADEPGGLVVPFVRPGTGAPAPPAAGEPPRPVHQRSRHHTGPRPHRPATGHDGRAAAAPAAPEPAPPDAPATPDGLAAPDAIFDQDLLADGAGTPGDAADGPRPAVDPRIRARRVAIRRAEGRRRLRVLLGAVAVLIVATVALGAPHLLGGGPAVPTAGRPVAVGWVAVPAPKGGHGGPTVAVVDGTGRVVQRSLLPPAGLPQLTGAATAGEPGTLIRPVSAARVARLLPADLRARAATLAVHRGLFTMGLDKGPEIRFGTPDGLALKGRTAFAILSALTTHVRYIDVRVPSAPVTG